MNEKEIENKMKKFMKTIMNLSESENLSTYEIFEIAARKAGFVTYTKSL